MRIVHAARGVALCGVFAHALAAQQPAAPPKYDRAKYDHSSADIPMRDGLKLFDCHSYKRLHSVFLCKGCYPSLRAFGGPSFGRFKESLRSIYEVIG